MSRLARISKMVDKQIGILESWSEGNEGGLTPEQIDQLETIARLVRQLELTDEEPEATGPGAESGSSLEELLGQIPGKR